MRKKLFAVIMSAMMMITFMPTMAFADAVNGMVTKITWEPDYTVAHVYLLGVDDPYDVEPTFSFDNTAASPTIGAHKAVIADADITTAITNAGDTCTLDTSNVTADMTKVFYDFNGAKFVPNTGSTFKLGADAYCALIDQTKAFGNPEFATGKTIADVLGANIEFTQNTNYVELLPSETAPKKAKAAYTTLVTGLNETVVLPRYEKYQATGDFDVKYSATAKVGYDNYLNCDKMVTDYKLNISSANFGEAKVKLAGMKSAQDLFSASGTTFNTTYVGADQAITLETKGLTATYSVDGGKTYSATAPEMKDVKDGYAFKMKVTGSRSKVFDVTVNVKPAVGRIEYKKAAFFFAPKTEVKASDLVDFVAYYAGTDGTAGKEFNAANKVTVSEADNAIAKEAIDKYVKINGLDNGNPKNTGVKVAVDKELLTAAVKADEKAFNFVKSFGTYAGTPAVADVLVDAATYATGVSVEFGTEYNDITAPNKTVTYKAKKGKLAKTKTYTLKATADFGTITFTKMNTKGGSKIKVANSGKVTIKKGLKKGTYKVKVKVKAPGTKANMFLTVKVK